MGLKSKAGDGVKLVGRAAGRSASLLGVGVANAQRRLLHGRLPDYVVITLDRAVSDRAGQRPWWLNYVPGVEEQLSLEGLASALQRIAGDPDVRGVVLLLKGAELSLSRAQSFAALLRRFREWDAERNVGPAKEVVIYAEAVDAPTAVLLSAADRAILPPLATWDVIGLQVTSTFLKDSLARLGVEVEVARVAPWKTAADAVSRSEMSDAQREQLNWLLDSLHGTLVEAISCGRNLAPERVAALIDRGPLTAEEALDAGLIDVIAYEDELALVLGKAKAEDEVSTHSTPSTGPSTSSGRDSGQASSGQAGSPQGDEVRLGSYEQMQRLLKHYADPPPAGRIGVIALEGAIVPGRSRSFPVPLPLLGDNLIGSTTAQQQIRAARRNDDLDAVIVYVDSPGGSALASDLIWRELTLLDAEKPVVVYMGAVAASGGYYIATPGRKIVAQASTLTGSIGVIVAKAVTQALVEKVGASTEIVRRGENAGIYRSDTPWSSTQRALVDEQVDFTYRAFKQRVADGRGIALEALDPLCGGRVWTGDQALRYGLVDAVGDFDTALALAKELANVDADARVETVPITPEKRPVLPMPAQDAAAFVREFVDGSLLNLLRSERCWLLADDIASLRHAINIT